MTIIRRSKFFYAGLIILGILIFVFAEEKLEDLSFDQYFSFDIKKTLIIFSLLLTFIGVAGIIAHNRSQEKSVLRSYYSLVKNRQSSDKEIERKINNIFNQMDKVRMYRRHVWGIGDFTPLIRTRRYIVPSDDVIKYIDSLENSLFSYIAQHGDEQAVDKSLAKATEITQEIIENLNSAK
jgi:hypothetical protein